MPEVCQLLRNAIIDERDGIKFYDRLITKVDKDSQWKIKKIRDEEFAHMVELMVIKARLHCG